MLREESGRLEIILGGASSRKRQATSIVSLRWENSWTIHVAEIRIFNRERDRDECVKPCSKGSRTSNFLHITHFTGLYFLPALITHRTNLTIIVILITVHRLTEFLKSSIFKLSEVCYLYKALERKETWILHMSSRTYHIRSLESYCYMHKLIAN